MYIFLVGAVTYFRCKLVRHVCEVRPEIASSKVLLANNISGWLAFISVVCLIFVAHFQVNTTLLLHGFTAFVGIGLGVIYCCMQVNKFHFRETGHRTSYPFLLRIFLT